MNAIVREIEGLKSRISYIEFNDHMSSQDYQDVRECEEKIRELKKRLIGVRGVTVFYEYKDKEHYSERGFYLTANPTLCCSGVPTMFDDENEAREYIGKAKISDPERYNIKILPVIYTENGWKVEEE